MKTHTFKPAGQFMSVIVCRPCDYYYLNTEGVTMLSRFLWIGWPRRRFSESYTLRVWVTMSWNCQFRVIKGIKTGLLGRCLIEAPSGPNANDCVKTLASLRFWRNNSPWVLGCFTNNAAASTIFHNYTYNTRSTHTQNPPQPRPLCPKNCMLSFRTNHSTVFYPNNDQWAPTRSHQRDIQCGGNPPQSKNIRSHIHRSRLTDIWPRCRSSWQTSTVELLGMSLLQKIDKI